MAGARAAELRGGSHFLWFAVGILALFFAKALLVPLAFALTLTFLLAPGVERLERWRVPRLVAVMIVGGVTFVGLCGAGYVVTRQLMEVARTLPSYRANIHARMVALHSPAEQSVEQALGAMKGIGEEFSLGTGGESAAGTGATAKNSEAMPVRVVDPATGLETAMRLAREVLEPVGTLLVVVVFAIYMLMKREELRHRLLLLAGMGHLNVMTQALGEAAERISDYLVMQFAVNACYGALFGAGLYVIGVPYATLWGVLAGVLRIVPYVGTLTGVVLPLVVSVAISTSWWPPVLVVVLFVVLELSVTNFVEPWLFSTRTGISSLALLVSAIFWALLWGWPGLVLSTPLTVCMVVLGTYIPQMSFLQTLLGAHAELSPEAHFYERLLAMDQREGRAIAERFLKEHSLVALYDEVLIPALSLAEQDRHRGGLDEVRFNFVFLCISELVAELAEYRAEGEGILEGRGEFAVVCLSARDQADELSTTMLAQLMERAGHPTLVLSTASLSDEVLGGLAAAPETVVFISALPPFAFSQARAACQRVRGKMPKNRIAVGLWHTEDDKEQMAERLGSGKPDVVVGLMAEALLQVTMWQKKAVGSS